jgi:mannose-1-phosphate guanylyltransferase/phosphomannomutase
MIPDQYSPNVHLFTESFTEDAGEELQTEYKNKINTWIEEHN